MAEKETRHFDFLVLGSGIAGLFCALKLAPMGRVAVITKKHSAESNTNYAQGGIAAVMSRDDTFDLHVRDTLTAGAGLCREAVVRTIVQEGPPRIQELIELGMRFSQREGAIGLVQTQRGIFGSAGFGVRSVTVIAVLRENRLDVFVEGNLLRHGKHRSGCLFHMLGLARCLVTSSE